MKELLDRVLSECAGYAAGGRVASYIPELKKADKSDFGIAIIKENGEYYAVGDYSKRFTAQSVIKPIILLLALMDNGIERVEELCGVEATGKPFDAFNYSDRALTGEHINPMINAGAIALCTLIHGDSGEEKFRRLLDLAKTLSGNATLDIDMSVYKSEKQTGNKNRALAYMLKAYGLIDADIEDTLDIYFKACSVLVDCQDLARIGLVLANRGALNGARLVDEEYTRYVSAIMTICGMYDGSGEFALRVGIPAKSGVGGGIMASAPGKMGIGVYSPSLDKKGNSLCGVRALEMISRELKLSIY